MRVCHTDEQVGVVVLLRAVVAGVAAFDAFVRDDEAPLRVGRHGDRAHQAPAAARTVAGQDVEVQRAETARTVVAGGIPQHSRS